MAKPARPPSDDPTWPWMAAGIAGVLTVIYLVFFFVWGIGGGGSTLPRFQLFLVLLTPDEVVRNFAAGDVARGVVDRTVALGATAAFLWCALWIGWWPLAWLMPVSDRPVSERSVLATALGLHLVSLLTLVVGLAGLLRTPVLAAALGIAAVALPISALVRSRRRVKGVGSLFRPKSLPLEEPSAEKDSRPRYLWMALT